MLNHLIIPIHWQNVSSFCYIWRLSRFLLDNCLIILDFTQTPYSRYYYCFWFVTTPDRDYCYPDQLSCWCSVIVPKYPGLEGEIILLLCKGFHWKSFLRVQIEPRYWQCISLLQLYLLSGLFNPIFELTFVCYWVATLRPSGEWIYLNIYFSQFWIKSESGCCLCPPK